jgi:hypothetical protein
MSQTGPALSPKRRAVPPGGLPDLTRLRQSSTSRMRFATLGTPSLSTTKSM